MPGLARLAPGGGPGGRRYCGLRRARFPLVETRTGRRACASRLARAPAGGGARRPGSIPDGAPDEYDLTKWALCELLRLDGLLPGGQEGSRSRPLAVPRRVSRLDPSQDSLHIGTHPPGLIALQCLLLERMERIPGGRYPDSRHADLDGGRFPSSTGSTGRRFLVPIAPRCSRQLLTC